MANFLEKVRQPRGALLFREIQQIRQTWIWALVVILSLFLIVIFVHAMVKQLILGEPWGNHPMSDTMLLIFGLFFLFFSAGILWLFWMLRLVTEVRTDGIYIRFVPLFRKYRRIPLDAIREYEARRYHPIREYGGWGICYSRSGRAYNISGNRGIQLVLKDGSRILIGSQKPEEFVRALREASGSWEIPPQ